MLDYSNVNGHNNMYIILFGNDRYSPDLHLRNVPFSRQFKRLSDARKYAAEHDDAYIFKLHIYRHDDIEPDIYRIY